MGSAGLVVVGVADMAIGSAAKDRQIITYALGSCIGLTAYDPVSKVGGMVHFMLPQPSPQQDPAELKPYMYATTGVALLFRRLADSGAQKARLVVCAAGAAQIMSDNGTFAVGKRNHTMLRKILWKDGTVLAGEDTGGNLARTLSLDLGDGSVRVKTREGTKALWVPLMPSTPQQIGRTK
ncbi:MAG: chemotaxis protein CheD [Planctomycetes bacterium]|nr:chemotaxis protein CheD [Planctomycetota bacterium]